MLAYVTVAPLAGAFRHGISRKGFMISLDMARALSVSLFPFVTEVWQIYLLVFLFQSFSACFTPTFQAAIPDILSSEEDYTRALSLSRLAYDLESLLSPAFAALLLSFLPFHWLFAGTALGFVASAALVSSVVLPGLEQSRAVAQGFRDKYSRGFRFYLATPRLRGLLALCLAVSAAGSIVVVNSVVLVQDHLSLGEVELAAFMAFHGAGSMIVALSLPRFLERRGDRTPMILGAFSLSAILFLGVVALISLQRTALIVVLLGVWTLLGAACSLVLTPSGRLLARSAHKEDRPAIYAAYFALSHTGWLFAYPLAGWFGLWLGLEGFDVCDGASQLGSGLPGGGSVASTGAGGGPGTSALPCETQSFA